VSIALLHLMLLCTSWRLAAPVS